MKKIVMVVIGVLVFGFAGAQTAGNIVMEAGVAVIKGRIVGLPQDARQPNLVINKFSWEVEVAADGTFEDSVLLPHTQVAYVDFGDSFVNASVLLTPGDTVSMTIDYAKLPVVTDSVTKPYVHYTGPNAQLNNELGMINLQREYKVEPPQFSLIFLDTKLTSNELGQLMWTRRNLIVDYINNSKKLSPEAKLFLSVRADNDLLNVLSQISYNTMKQFKSRYTETPLASKWFKNLIDTHIVGPEIYAYGHISEDALRSLAIFCAPGSEHGTVITNVAQYAIDSLQSITPDERRSLAKAIVILKQSNASKDKLCTALENIRIVSAQYNQVVDSMILIGIRGFTGSDESALVEFALIQRYQNKIDNGKALTEQDFADMKAKINTLTCYIDYLRLKNDELLATIETNKSRSGYTVLELGDIPADQVLPALTARFPGKVLFIDFWATWCSPCRSAMKETEPVKSEFSAATVEFIFITEPSSPRQTWENMIPEITGTHVMLTKDQWDALARELGIQGVPSYLVLDAAGQKSHFQVGAISADEMRQQINTVLNK